MLATSMVELVEFFGLKYQFSCQRVYVKYQHNHMICFFIDCRPSTFAQAAKLRRLAAAKEKELANCEAIYSSTHLLIFTHFKDLSACIIYKVVFLLIC